MYFDSPGQKSPRFFAADGRQSAAALAAARVTKSEADDCALDKIRQMSATLRRYEEKLAVPAMAALSRAARRSLEGPAALLEAGAGFVSADDKKHTGEPQHRFVPRP